MHQRGRASGARVAGRVPDGGASAFLGSADEALGHPSSADRPCGRSPPCRGPAEDHRLEATSMAATADERPEHHQLLVRRSRRACPAPCGHRGCDSCPGLCDLYATDLSRTSYGCNELRERAAFAVGPLELTVRASRYPFVDPGVRSTPLWGDRPRRVANPTVRDRVQRPLRHRLTNGLGTNVHTPTIGSTFKHLPRPRLVRTPRGASRQPEHFFRSRPTHPSAGHPPAARGPLGLDELGPPDRPPMHRQRLRERGHSSG